MTLLLWSLGGEGITITSFNEWQWMKRTKELSTKQSVNLINENNPINILKLCCIMTPILNHLSIGQIWTFSHAFRVTPLRPSDITMIPSSSSPLSDNMVLIMYRRRGSSSWWTSDRLSSIHLLRLLSPSYSHRQWHLTFIMRMMNTVHNSPTVVQHSHITLVGNSKAPLPFSSLLFSMTVWIVWDWHVLDRFSINSPSNLDTQYWGGIDSKIGSWKLWSSMANCIATSHCTTSTNEILLIHWVWMTHSPRAVVWR